MTGLGETVEAVPPHGTAPFYAVMVNPLAPVPADKTAQVFRALGAATFTARVRASAAAYGPGRQRRSVADGARCDRTRSHRQRNASFLKLLPF